MLSTAFQRCPKAVQRIARSHARGAARGISFFGLGREPPVKADELFKEVKGLHEAVLSPLNAKFLGPLEKSSEEIIPLPVVFVLGNHSSGKSSFINHVAGRRVQDTGVAPTDDGFTVIVKGSADADQDGPALIGDPSLGFSGLRQHGNALINHLSLKIRSGIGIENVMLVDSPGMIDSPVAPANAAAAASGGHYGVSSAEAAAAARVRERGYDFSAVVRWFAERADVILLFQDPAKPGTTGETLNIMTTALAGADYKTFIILNKADQFSTVHDFARAYGALCWNLSKVIPRKDLPRIYTMRVPVKNPDREGGARAVPSSSGSGSGSAADSAVLKDALPDLDSTLQEIIAEVHRAPLRRVDNLITRLYDSARLLRMHATVLAAVKREYARDVLKAVAPAAALAAGLSALSGTLMMAGAFELGAPLAAVTLLGTVGGSWYIQRHLGQRAEYYVEGPGLEEAFRRTHFLSLAERDEFTGQLWERVRTPLRTALRTLGLRALPAPKRSELAAIDAIVSESVPSLRRAATKAGALFPERPSAGAAAAADAAVAAADAAAAAAPAAATVPTAGAAKAAAAASKPSSLPKSGA